MSNVRFINTGVESEICRLSANTGFSEFTPNSSSFCWVSFYYEAKRVLPDGWLKDSMLSLMREEFNRELKNR